MSNVIKSGYVTLSGAEKKIIDSNTEDFRTISVFQNASVNDNISPDTDEEYQEDTIRDVTKLLKERENALALEEERLNDKADKIIAEASKNAEAVLSNARKQSENITETARSQGYEDGYNEGIRQGEAQIQLMKQEIEEELSEKQREFTEKVSGFEVDFVDLASSIIEKITGILVEDKQDVIIHIINRSLSEIESSGNYLIRVSREDYENVCSKKQHFQDCLREGSLLEISESENLTKNKCLIETDNSVIDCSLDAQLNNLLTDLKILSRI